MKKAILFNRFMCVVMLLCMCFDHKAPYEKRAARNIFRRGYWWQFLGYILTECPVLSVFDYTEWYDAVCNFRIDCKAQSEPLLTMEEEQQCAAECRQLVRSYYMSKGIAVQ